MDVVLPADAVNGESPGWNEARRVLYFVDVRGPALHNGGGEEVSLTSNNITGPPGWASDPREAKAAGALVRAAAGAASVALFVDWLVGVRAPRRPHRRRAAKSLKLGSSSQALHAASALLSASVLADSAVEFYPGAFDNRGMYTPLVASALGVLAAADGATGGRLPRGVRAGVYGLASCVGAVGVGFHVYNLLRRPGGLNWLNLFYAAPVGAPAALALAGAIGLSADQIGAAPAQTSTVFGVPAGRVLAALTGAGLLGTVRETGLLHF